MSAGSAVANAAAENAKAYEQISNVIDQYRGCEGSLIQVLHRAQEIYGYLPLELQEFIAREMDLPLAKISGVVSFYSFFSTEPRGEHTIRVCLGTACYVRGGKKIVDQLQSQLGVDVGGTTADGKFSFEVARCIGACGLAPAMLIDDTVYKQVNSNRLEQILKKY
jgi:NADH:ubiquinone oxidoreductase 24 kD subunit